MITKANERACAMIAEASPYLVDVVYAREELDFPADTPCVQHAGPPLEWDEMCGPLQGAIAGVCVYEGWADTVEEGFELAASGGVVFRHNHSQLCVGPMTGMISPSMPLLKVENKAFGNVAYSSFNEGVGKVMRFGANGPEVIDRLRWLQRSFAPVLKRALEKLGGLDLRVIVAKALSMGDELHQRNIAASSLFFRGIMPSLVASAHELRPSDTALLEELSSFLQTNDQFFLNLAMACAKATIDPIKGIEHCSLVTAMSRNGTRFGIKVSALGDQWFEAPVNMPQGLYFPGFTEADANPDIGDSAIVECVGFGGMSMAAAPAVTQFVGMERADEAFEISSRMYEITQAKSRVYSIPALNFSGIPTGIDIIKVVETGILPYINSGIAHKKAGVGQVGAGVVFPPLACFEKALIAFAGKYGVES